MASHRKQCPHGSFGTLVAVAAAAGVAGAAAGAALMWARARHAPHDTSGSGCPSRPEAAATARGGDHHSDIKASSSATSPAGATVDNGGDGGAAAATVPGHASLSVRGQSALKPPFSYLADFFAALGDLYHKDTNPAGSLVLCIAENRQCVPQMAAKLRQVSAEAGDAVCDVVTTSYGNMSGMDRFRHAFTAMIRATAVRRAPLDVDSLFVTSGVSGAVNHLSVTLCDPGDLVLLPTPYYAGFRVDVNAVAQAELLPVECDAPRFVPTVQALSKAVATARSNGRRVRSLLLTNPGNPTGVVLTEAELAAVVVWCVTNRIHLLADEIYCNSEFTVSSDGTPQFVSVVDVMHSMLGDDGSCDGGRVTRAGCDEYVHVLWGMSKDFGVSGFRVGAVYTHNAALKAALGNLGPFTLPGHYTQAVLSRVLEDLTWVHGYLADCKAVAREGYAIVTSALDSAGVPYTPAAAGMFVWASFAQFLPSDAPTAADEAALMGHIVATARVVITPGLACGASSPGYVRIITTWHSPAELRVAIHRALQAATEFAELQRAKRT